MSAPSDAERAREIAETTRLLSLGTRHNLEDRIAAALSAARAEEREACARECEANIGAFGGNPDYALQKIAAAIRGRKP